MTDDDRLIDALDRFRRSIEANREPAVRGDEAEALHDLRVAVRRTRSGLKHSKGVLPRKKRTRFQTDFAWLQDVTGPARDFEVWMADLPDDDPLKLVLAGYHDAARREASTALESGRTTRLLGRWHWTLARLPAGQTSISSERQIREQHARVLDAVAVAPFDAPAEDLHRLRKRTKELRYLIELFAHDDAPAGRAAMRKELKKLQEVLGHVQDVAVQRAWLTEHADEVGAVDVRLKELDERDAAARAAYRERLAVFIGLDAGA